MGTTIDIDGSIKELSEWRKDLNYDNGDYYYGGNTTEHSLDCAISIMRKYQKIQNKLDQLEHEMELTLESDPRTMINRESEDGWLFDKISRWKKALEEIEGEIEDGNNRA